MSHLHVFAVYDDKSQYPYVLCEENIFQINLLTRFQKRSDLSLYDHKFDLIWKTREPVHSLI